MAFIAMGNVWLMHQQSGSRRVTVVGWGGAGACQKVAARMLSFRCCADGPNGRPDHNSLRGGSVQLAS